MNKRTVSVRLEPEEAQRLEKAARLAGQSQGAFLQKAGEEAAHRTLLAWATNRYRRGEGSFSELAEESGLAVEEIMAAMGTEGSDAALEMFLASAKTISDIQNNPSFLRLAREVVREVSGDRAA